MGNLKSKMKKSKNKEKKSSKSNGDKPLPLPESSSARKTVDPRLPFSNYRQVFSTRNAWKAVSRCMEDTSKENLIRLVTIELEMHRIYFLFSVFCCCCCFYFTVIWYILVMCVYEVIVCVCACACVCVCALSIYNRVCEKHPVVQSVILYNVVVA
jgi:hypothetical protein